MSKFQPKNTAGLRNGSRTKRAGLVLAELGPKYKAIYQNTKQFRKSLESLVTPAHGQLSLLDVGRINEAVRWEVVSRIVLKLVADNPAMPPGEVVSSLNTVANATRNRNAIMAKLLNGKETNAASDPWAALLESPLPAHQDNASGANGHQGDALDGPAENAANATPEGLGSTDTPRQNSTGNSTAENHAENSTAVEISFGRGGE